MAAPKTPLKVVTEADAPPVPKSLKEAVELGERSLLVAMRNKVMTEIDNGVPAAYLAPLMRQVRDIDKEIRMFDLRAKQEAEEDAIAVDEEWNSEAL